MLRDIAAEQLRLQKIKRQEDVFIREVLSDFWICCVSREASILGRKEVLSGKAKFGILGDGKEVPQVALARFFQKGDWRSGYYRDQTWMFATGVATVEDFFADRDDHITARSRIIDIFRIWTIALREYLYEQGEYASSIPRVLDTLRRAELQLQKNVHPRLVVEHVLLSIP